VWGRKILCVLSNNHLESVNHLFITCTVTQSIWDMIDKWVGVTYVRHFNVRNHFLNFQLMVLNSNQNKVWKGVWITVI